MTATQQQKRITLGKAARRVTIRIYGGPAGGGGKTESKVAHWMSYIDKKKKVDFQSADVLLNQLEAVKVTYIVFLEEREVTDDSHPHQEGGGAQQDGAQVVR